MLYNCIFLLSISPLFANNIWQRLRKNRYIQLDKLYKHWQISREPSNRALVLYLLVLNSISVGQERKKPRIVFNKQALPPNVVIVIFLQADNRTIGPNIASPLIRNRRDKLKVRKTQQVLQNISDRKVNNLRTNKSLPRDKLQDNKTRDEIKPRKKSTQEFRLYESRQNLSVFEL